MPLQTLLVDNLKIRARLKINPLSIKITKRLKNPTFSPWSTYPKSSLARAAMTKPPLMSRIRMSRIQIDVQPGLQVNMMRALLFFQLFQSVMRSRCHLSLSACSFRPRTTKTREARMPPQNVSSSLRRLNHFSVSESSHSLQNRTS